GRPQESVIHARGVVVKSGNRSGGIDAVGLGTLSRTCASARGVEVRDHSGCGAHEAMQHTAGINRKSSDYIPRVEGCACGARDCARRVEVGKPARRGTYETVPDVVPVDIAPGNATCGIDVDAAVP